MIHEKILLAQAKKALEAYERVVEGGRKGGKIGGAKNAGKGTEYFKEIGRKGGLKRAENRRKKLSTGDDIPPIA